MDHKTVEITNYTHYTQSEGTADLNTVITSFKLFHLGYKNLNGAPHVMQE